MRYTLKQFRKLADQIFNLKPDMPINIEGEKYEFPKKDLNTLQEVVGTIVNTKIEGIYIAPVILERYVVISSRFGNVVFFYLTKK